MYRILMVTGKGGVGKSFTAAVLAAQIARKGRKTLLVEMGPWSFLQKVLELPERRSFFTPLKTQYGFDHAVWPGEDCLTDYVKYLIKVPWAAEAFLKNAWLRSLIQVAPGLKEISFLGKLTSPIRQHGPKLDYDTIVVDAVSSGHYLNLLRTPRGLMDITKVGPLREQSTSIFEVLNDAKLFHTIVVSNLETFSVQESREMTLQMKNWVSSDYSFVANKVYPIPSGQLEGTSKVQEFMKEQIKMKDFQQKQFETLAEQKTTHKIDFIFQPLKEFIKNEHPNLFAEL